MLNQKKESKLANSCKSLKFTNILQLHFIQVQILKLKKKKKEEENPHNWNEPDLWKPFPSDIIQDLLSRSKRNSQIFKITVTAKSLKKKINWFSK